MDSSIPSFTAVANWASPLLCSVAAYGLAGSNDHTELHLGFPAQPLDDPEWRRLISAARHERLLGFLASAVADEALPTTLEQAEELRRAHINELCRDLICERHLIEVVAVLTAADLDHRVLKGSAVAHLDYPEPALRSFTDVDLLVRAEQWDQAINVLANAGWERRFPEPRPGFDRRFVKGVVLNRVDDDMRTELDLHRTLALGPFGLTVRLSDLWDGHDVLPIGGEELRCLEVEERFLHACFHAVLGEYPPRLTPLRDIAQIGLSEELDLDLVIELARSWQAEAVLLSAVNASWSTLRLDDSAEVFVRANSLRPGRRELRALRPYLTPKRSYVELCWAATRAIRRPSDKARYVAALAFPSRQFLEPRYPGRIARWRAAARVLRAGRGPTRKTSWDQAG